MKSYLVLTKTGIIVFTLVSALAGYAVSLPVGYTLDPLVPVVLMLGLYCVAAGSFAINQAQEWRIDALMKRTKVRPIPKGIVSPWQAILVGVVLLVFGLSVLFVLEAVTGWVALITVLLYNGMYTLYWKRKWAFGAVPGAIPGALPVVIGYSVNTPHVFSPECVYLFLILFLWQMPHFWALAIRFRKDYEAGGIPVLPVRLGEERTLYHIGLYLFVYVGVALAAPWFFKMNLIYMFLVLPLAIKLVWEFAKFYRLRDKQWLPFFLWTNLSVLVFLAAPVVDKWIFWYANS